jgi:hypothetical protein
VRKFAFKWVYHLLGNFVLKKVSFTTLYLLASNGQAGRVVQLAISLINSPKLLPLEYHRLRLYPLL